MPAGHLALSDGGAGYDIGGGLWQVYITRISILAVLLGCDDGEPTETGAVDDTDTDTDTDTTPTTELDCADGVDNDQDGLTDCEDGDCACIETDCGDGIDDDSDGLLDCEDDDCVDVCIEDCGDGSDNDRDGLTDCDDDECYGVEPCGGPYTVSMSTFLDAFIWVGGGKSLSKYYSIYAPVFLAYGSVDVVARPDGWSGASINCSAGLDISYYNLSKSITSNGASYYGGPSSAYDYVFYLDPNVSDGSLGWSSSCPVSIPPLYLGLDNSTGNVGRHNGDGAWELAYITDNFDSDYRSSGVNVFYAMDVKQLSLRYWTGVY